MEKFIPEILRGSSCPVHCPLCQAKLNITNIHSANCLNGHQFDFAAPGFIDLLAGSGHSIYNIELAIATAGRAPLRQESAIFGKFLNAVITAIHHVHIVISIKR